MRILTPAPGLRSNLKSSWKALTSGSPYVLQVHEIMSFGFRTYAVVEALLKIGNFNLFIIRTYTKLSDKPFRMHTYKGDNIVDES